jgi:putative membrane protein
MIKKVTVTAAVLAAGFIASLGYTAVAQTNRPAERANPTNQPATQPDPNRISAVDRTFMITAAQSNLAEVELSQLALRQSTRASNEVQQYAQQMIQDHTLANNRLSQLASQKDVTLPTTPDAEHQALSAQLAQLSGREFDQAYMKAMQGDHVRAVTLFQNAAQRAEDPAVRTFATNILPRLQDHLQMSRAMTDNSTRQKPNSQNR